MTLPTAVARWSGHEVTHRPDHRLAVGHVIQAPSWRPSKSTLYRLTSNALVPDTLAGLGGSACFNDVGVEVARTLEASWEVQPNSVYVPG